MKNLIITALTIFAFITGPVMAGERSFDMDNAFAYTKSTQSLGSEGSAGSVGGLSSGAATGILVFIGLVILVALIASNSGDDHNYSGGST